MENPRPDTHQVTALLDAHRQGDAGAFDELVELLYVELRRLARRWRQGPAATLNSTALVNEAYLRMAGGDCEWRDRTHFLAAAAQAMRHIAVDYARGQLRQKRGGGLVQTDLNERHGAGAHDLGTIVAVDTVLAELAHSSPRTVRVIECRYFAGMTADETAAALDTSLSTVEREWRAGKSALKARFAGGGGA
jgi:RNA polymerase sigma factor (TIGR02999 family)